MDVGKLNRDFKKSWQTLSGDDAIESFEKRWYEWDINDTLKWFDFILKTRDCTCDCDVSSSEDDSEQDSEDNDDHDNTNINSGEFDKQFVKSRLEAFDFSAKMNLPYMMKPFHFQQYGLKNKFHCRLLSKNTKRLIKQYPRKNSKHKKQRTQKETEKENSDDENEIDLESLFAPLAFFVQKHLK